MSRKNKLRADKSKSFIITASIIGFLILFGAGMYLAYLYINFLKFSNIEKLLSINDFTSLLSYISKPEIVVSLNVSVLFTMLKYQVLKLWWMYVISLFIVFMASSGRPKDEYKGMEHGSASWSDKYEEKSFKDQTGIPVALNTYVTINNPKDKYYLSHNLNEVVIGGSGAGKSFRKIKPDIMQMYGSYVVTDPKGVRPDRA